MATIKRKSKRQHVENNKGYIMNIINFFENNK
jgi:hypothetical protein